MEQEKKTIAKVGFYASIFTTVITIVTFAVSVATPPPAGPYCTANCYTYPFLDVVSRFPRDYYWMFAAMLWSLFYFALMVCVHYYASLEKKIFSHIGLSFALITTAVLFINYFVQVSVIQPSLLNGEFDGIALLSQYNPHGVFIALEEIGYLLMSFAFLFTAPVFAGKNKLERAIRWIFVSNFVLTILALVAYSYVYGVFREYRFEVASISINWTTLIICGILLSLVFKREQRRVS